MNKDIQEIYRKYNIELDYGKFYQTVSSSIREYNYLRETYYRLSLDKDISFVPTVSGIAGVVHFNYLFTDDYFSYNLQHAEYHKDELENFYAVVLFLDSNFYIDDTWDLKKVELLSEMLKDEDINKLCLNYLDKQSWELVRETSYYYKDEVWKYVCENELLPHMRKANLSSNEKKESEGQEG